MASTQQMNHATMAKRGFALGVGLFALGVLGEVTGATVGSLPAWSDMLLTDLEGLGILLSLLSPLVFGIVMPLVE